MQRPVERTVKSLSAVILWSVVVLQLSISSVSLGADRIEYSKIDFLTLPPPTLPYIIQDNGYVLRCCMARPPGAWYPKDVSLWVLLP
jgi:hypothetical protein